MRLYIAFTNTLSLSINRGRMLAQQDRNCIWNYESKKITMRLLLLLLYILDLIAYIIIILVHILL